MRFAAAGRTRTTTTARSPRGRSLAWRARTTRSTRCRRSPAGSAASRSRPRTSSRRITPARAAVITTGVRLGQFVSLILQKVWLSGLHEKYALSLAGAANRGRPQTQGRPQNKARPASGSRRQQQPRQQQQGPQARPQQAPRRQHQPQPAQQPRRPQPAQPRRPQQPRPQSAPAPPLPIGNGGSDEVGCFCVSIQNDKISHQRDIEQFTFV